MSGCPPAALTTKKILDFQPLSRHIFLCYAYMDGRQMRKARFPVWAILSAGYDTLVVSIHLLFYETMGLCSNP